MQKYKKTKKHNNADKCCSDKWYDRRKMSGNSLRTLRSCACEVVNVCWWDVCLFMCMCVVLQAYRFLAINKKLGLSGRPERPVGCIGTCKVYETAETYTHMHTHILYLLSVHCGCTGHLYLLNTLPIYRSAYIWPCSEKSSTAQKLNLEAENIYLQELFFSSHAYTMHQ